MNNLTENTFELDLGLAPPPKVDEIESEFFKSDLLSDKAQGLPSYNAHGVVKILRFRCVADKDYAAESAFLLCLIPFSSVRILGFQSRVYGRFESEDATYNVGWAGFNARHRDIRESSRDGLVDNCESEKTYTLLRRAPLQSTVFDSLGGVTVQAIVDQSGVAGDYIEGILMYVKK